MDYKELKWSCEARAEVFRTMRNEAGAMHEEQCSRAIADLLSRAEAAEARAEKAEHDMKRIVNQSSYPCEYCTKRKCLSDIRKRKCFDFEWRGQKEE